MSEALATPSAIEKSASLEDEENKGEAVVEDTTPAVKTPVKVEHEEIKKHEITEDAATQAPVSFLGD